MKFGLPNFGMAIAATAMSISIWLYVQTQEARKTTELLEVPVQAITFNEPGFEAPYVVQKIPRKVTIKLEGTPEELERFNSLYSLVKNEQTGKFTQEAGRGRSKLEAQIDLTELSPDQSTIRPLPFRNKDLAPIRAEYFQELPITVEERARRPVKVEVNVIKAPTGFVPTAVNVDPATVEVTGAKSVVQIVSKLTGTIDLTGYKPGQTYRVGIQPRREDGELVENVTLTESFVSATPILAERPRDNSYVVEVVFASGQKLAPGYRISNFYAEPLTIRAIGAAPNIRSILTKPIRIEGLNSSRVLTKVALQVPPGVEGLVPSTVTVRLFIEKIPVIENPLPVTPPTSSTTGTTSGTTGTPPNQ